MRRLLLRELRRLLAPGLAMLGLGISVVLLMLVPTLLFETRRIDLDIAFVIVAIGTPWLMGAVAVAPDSETGAEAFLRTLPVSRRRLLAVRWSSAAVWCVAVVGAFAFFCQLAQGLLVPAFEIGLWRESFLVTALIGSLVMFPAGALSSVLCSQTLLAFVIAPLLCLGPAVAFGLAGREVGLPEELILFLPALVLPGLLLLAAYWAYTRVGVERVRGIPRPVALVGAVTLGTFLLSCGLSTAAYALDRGVPQWHFRGDKVGNAPVGRALVALQPSSRLNWRRMLTRVDPFLYQQFRFLVLTAENRDDPWVLPDRLQPVSFSPDGQKLLAFDHAELRWELLDVASRSRTRGQPGQRKTTDQLSRRHRLLVSDGLQGTANPHPVLWQDGQPYLTERRGVVAWDGSGRRAWPAGTAELETAWGDLLILRGNDGVLRRWSLGGGAPTQISLPPLQRIEGTLAGRGRYLLVLGRNKANAFELWSVDLEPGNAVQLDVDLSGFGVQQGDNQIAVHSSPDRQHAIVQARWPRVGKTWIIKRQPPVLVDLSRGGARPVPLVPDATNDLRVIAWSPSGKRVVTRAGVWKVGAEALEDTRDFFWQALLFIDDERLLLHHTEYDFRTRVRSPFSGIWRHERWY